MWTSAPLPMLTASSLPAAPPRTLCGLTKPTSRQVSTAALCLPHACAQSGTLTRIVQVLLPMLFLTFLLCVYADADC